MQEASAEASLFFYGEIIAVVRGVREYLLRM